MAIACGNCGGTHDTVAQVRACHQVPMVPQSDAPPEPSDDPAGWSTPPPSPPPTPRAVPAPAAAVLAGPAALGRTLVVRPGQDVPADWAACPRVVLDDDAVREPTETTAQLAEWWTARRPYVVELAAALDRHPGETDDREPWRLDPSFTFPLERLAHLVWSNALDLRADTPTSEAVTLAAAAGAAVAPAGEGGDTPAMDDGTTAAAAGPTESGGSGDEPATPSAGELAGSSAADVVTATGEPAWCVRRCRVSTCPACTPAGRSRTPATSPGSPRRARRWCWSAPASSAASCSKPWRCAVSI